ncbi:MAG: hypothetical protein U0640_08155 [Phycisphaerales bacterium]
MDNQSSEPRDQALHSLSPTQREHVEAELAKQGIDPSQVQGVYVQKAAGFDQQQVTCLVKEGKHIEAIKLIREQSGLGLKEAKEAADALRASLGMKPKAGCAAMIVLVVGAGVLLAML